MKRIHFRDRDVAQQCVMTALEKSDSVRPIDMIKIVNSAASLGVLSEGLTARVSEMMQPKLESCFAQEFRDAVSTRYIKIEIKMFLEIRIRIIIQICDLCIIESLCVYFSLISYLLLSNPR
tara:strand:- start:514 stop:876 length:363 start_codon:yes stop_codon:yes gene_type:complete